MLMLLIAFFSLQCFAESPNPPRAGRYEARGTFSYYTTDTNYTSTGASALVGNGSFTNMAGEAAFIYDWQPDWRFSGGLNFSWVESDDSNFVRNNSGVNEVFVSGQKWYEMGPFDIVPQGDFVFPLWRASDSSDEALIGEGAMRLRGGSWLFWPQGTYKPFGYLGFEYRDGGRSFLLPYSLGVKFKVSQFWIQGEYRGSESIVDDADSDNEVIRENFLNRVNAGSMRFYSINPSSSEVAFGGGTQFGPWGIFAGFAITVNGNNAADGWTGYGGLSYSPAVITPGRHDDGFNIRRERYDETLFNEQRQDSEEPQFIEDPDFKEAAPTPSRKRQQRPPPAITPSQPVDIQLELRRVPPKKKKSPPKAPKRDKNLDKMMNEAEKALEKAD